MKRRGTCRWQAGGALLAFLVILVAGAGCRTGPGGESSIPRKPSRSPSEGIRGVTLSSYRVGDTRWVLQADTASVFREKKRVEAAPVQVDFFEEDDHVSVLTAKTGILIQATDDLEARGNVRVVSDDGAVLETEVLFWDHQRALIHTDVFVKLTRRGNVLTGIGMEADPGLDRFELKGGVDGTMVEAPEGLDDDEDTQTLTADPDSGGGE